MGTLVFFVSLAVIMLSYMLLWYGVSLYSHRFDVVDSAWGLGFVLVAWVSLFIRGNFGSLQLVSATLVSLWGVRIFTHLARRNWRRPEDDRRYQVLREEWGERAEQKAFSRIFLLQGALIVLVSIPMLALALIRHTPNVLSYIGFIIWASGIVYEAVADRQLVRFLAHRPKDSHEIMTKGLWRFSRHPNYFGEITTWWGAAIVSTSVGGRWGVFGAIAITYLITKVSGIPLLEKHFMNNKAYAAYREQTPMLIPQFPKRRAS